MRLTDCVLTSLILCTLFVSSRLLAQTQGSRASETHASVSVVQNPTVRKIVDTIQKKLTPIKGYSGVIERQSLDPNGGFDKFLDEETVCLPDKMIVKRKVLDAHNSSAVGQDITMVIDGTWSFTRIVRDQANHPGEPSYSKTDLKAVERAGGPSIPEYISMMGNVVDPLRPYRLDTLKLETETRADWVLLAQFKQEGTPWATNRLTIDKKTGFIQRIEAVIPELPEPVLLLNVKKVTAKEHFDESQFTMDLPSSDSPMKRPYVSDDTHMWIQSLEAKRTMTHNKKVTADSSAK